MVEEEGSGDGEVEEERVRVEVGLEGEGHVAAGGEGERVPMRVGERGGLIFLLLLVVSLQSYRFMAENRERNYFE